jgi:hypothetical protein
LTSEKQGFLVVFPSYDIRVKQEKINIKEKTAVVAQKADSFG